MLNHPEVATRDCDHCALYMYVHETGKLLLDSNGNPYPRPKNGKGPPCMTSPKACAKVSPTAGVELNEINLRAFEHYQECKSTGHFPDDPIVKQNAAIISRLEKSHETLMQVKIAGMRSK